MPTGLFGPYSASSVSPATIVGSANGRSMSALTSRLPRNSSRTSTQAMSVPDHRVDRGHDDRDDQRQLERRPAPRAPVTASQNAAEPAVERLRDDGGERDQDDQAQVGAMASAPSERRAAAASTARRAAPRRGAGSATASLGGGDAQVLLDLRDDALVRVEELVVDLVPAAEVVDREQARRRRELARSSRAASDRAVALGGEDLLRLRRVQEVDERLGLRRVLRVRRDRDRVLDQDRLVGDDVVERPAPSCWAVIASFS